MKRSLIVLGVLVCALLASASASAAQIAYTSVSGSWRDPVDNVPGVQTPGEPAISNGNPTSILRWGVPTSQSGTQSSYDYTATIPPPVTLPGTGPLFSLGTFTHRNFEVSDPSLRSVELDVVLLLSIDGVPTGPLNFTFTFNHHETPNNPQPPNTCPYPTPPNEGCTDRVTIVSSAQPTTFNVGGVDYTLSMSFLDADGNPVSEFITRENGTINTSGLVGQFTLPNVPIDEPVLNVEKSGPPTMSPGQWGDFVVDVQNIALAEAFNVALVDQLPNGSTGGMCDNAPQVTSARVFAADGSTPVPGKGALVEGSDYSLAFDNAACELVFNAITSASVIAPGERLVITYRTQLDAGTEHGVPLTNVVGATLWYNGASSDPDRDTYTRTLTNGTLGTLDHEDEHTVTVDFPSYYFEKTVANLTTGANPATTVSAGDTLRYTLRLQTVDHPVDDLTLYDELDALNATPGFEPGTLTLVSYPAGVDTSATNATGGANGTGVVDIRNLSLPAGSVAEVVFDVTLAQALPIASIVANQARLLLGTTPFAVSDDPNVNGRADPFVAGDEDPTRVQILDQQLSITKQVAVVGGGEALAGGELDYLVEVRNVSALPASSVVITDDVATPVAGLLTLIDPSVSMNGSTNGVTVAGSLITADYATVYGPLLPDQTITLAFRAQIVPGTPMGTTITNTAHVTWDDPPKTGSASASIDVGGLLELTVEKSGPLTMSPGQWGDFILDVHNVTLAEAFNVTVLDRLPDGSTGGMCDNAPQVSSARVFAADGTTPVPGKGALVEGADYSLAFDGAACELTFNAITDASVIGPDERLIVAYRTQLDAGTQNAATLTNVAGATQWYNAPVSDPDRQTYTQALTDGTVGTLDHEDAHTVTVDFPGYYFEKTVANLTTGANPATTVSAGDTLRYTLRLQTVDHPFDDLTLYDELDALNATPGFEPGTLTLVSYPAGVDTSATNATGGVNGTGLIEIRNLSLAAGSVAEVVFDVTLAQALPIASIVANQARLLLDTTPFAVSDDPNVNGRADPFVAGDEDPTRVQILDQQLSITKQVAVVGGGEALAGGELDYLVEVRNVSALPASSVVITDDVATPVAGLLTLIDPSVSMNGSTNGVTVAGSLITADYATTYGPLLPDQTITLALRAQIAPGTPMGTTITNTAHVTWDDPPKTGSASASIDVGGLLELTVSKSGPATMSPGQWGDFVLDVQNVTLADAFNVTVLDRLPDGPTGGMCDNAPQVSSAGVFAADGTTPIPGKGALVEGADYSLAFDGAACELTFNAITDASVIAPDERLVITYRAQLDAGTQNAVTLTNVAGATQWYNAPGTDPDRQTYTATLTDGTVGTLDHEDAHTVTVDFPGYYFEKTVVNLTTGANPATTVSAGDTLRYTLRLQTVDHPFDDLTLYDELDALNATPGYEPGTLALVTYPAGVDASATSATGGANGTGLIEIRNLSLAAGSVAEVVFDVTLAQALPIGSIVANQARLQLGSTPFASSDDPNVNGRADPLVAGDEDPTRVQILDQQLTITKQVAVVGGGDALAGGELDYLVEVRNVSALPASYVVITDDVATPIAGLITIVDQSASMNGSTDGVTVAGSLITGDFSTTYGPLLPDQSITLAFRAQIVPGTPMGTTITNTAHVKWDDPPKTGSASVSIDVGGLLELTVTKSGPATMSPGQWGDFVLDVQNVTLAEAFNVTLLDRLPDGPTGGMCDNAPEVTSARVFAADGTTPIPGKGALVEATDYSIAFDGATCELTFNAITDASAIAPDERLLITYRAQLDAGTENAVTLTNVAGATQWYNGPGTDPDRLTYTATLTDGTVGTLDHEDAHTVTVEFPNFFFEKTVVNLTTGTNPATTVSAGDTLRYTLRLQTGAQPLDDLTLYDELDALNATPGFEPGTLTLVSYPAGVDASATSATGGTNGTGLIEIRNLSLAADSVAEVVFDVTLAQALPIASIVANQARLQLGSTPFALSDDPNVNGRADPLVAGDEDPTRVQILDQQLTITKQVAVVGGGEALAGGELEYLVEVRNVSALPASYVVITDDVYMPVAGLLTLVDQSVSMNGSPNGVTVEGSLITADYATTYGPLLPDQTITLAFRAQIVPGTPMGTTITNTAHVKWDDPPKTGSASVSIDVGGMVGVGALNGIVWHDANFDTVPDANERLLEGWRVELYLDDTLLGTTPTDAAGVYRISGLEPNYQTINRYELRFVAPGAGPSSAKLGRAQSDFTNDLHRISDIVVQMGSNLQNLNLPIAPNGVVYDTISRNSIPGATLRMLQAGTGSALPASCFYDPAQQDQVTLANAYYRFDLNFSDPSCASGSSFAIEVTPPPSGYAPTPSDIIPPATSAATAPFVVPACPGGAADTIPATAGHCEVQVSAFAPGTAVPYRSAGTAYHLHLVLDDSRVPGSAQIFNNHIPLDPDLLAALAVTKTTPLLNVSRGQLVPYTLTVRNTGERPLLEDVRVIDRFPAGFRYVEGSARVDDVPTEPERVGNELVFHDLVLDIGQERTIVLVLAVGAGVGEGEFVNRAQAFWGPTGTVLSGVATATVRVTPDPTFDCTDITGKVFDDRNRNGLQDEGEKGLPLVRLVTARGISATTDAHGRYHITCATTPMEGRGSNFVLKLDDRTLPSGFRASTGQVRVQRATRGKALRMNFGASIYRVVSLDIADAVFEPGTTEMRVQWKPRMQLLMDELSRAPSVLRLSYLADVEDEVLVEERLAALRQEVLDAWKASEPSYPLTIEPETFWRLGGPPQTPPLRAESGR